MDFGPDPLAAFRVANALAAPLTAIFANSSVYDGRPTGHASYRADAWRRLDPGRTGVASPASDPVADYVRFALEARWFLGPGGPAPFGELLRSGDVGLDHWRTHLTTLFPEVRPKGWLEIRSCDALPPGALAAPVVLLLGILHHPPTLAEAAASLAPPSAGLLVRAGRDGLGDPQVAGLARSVVALGLRGARRLGADRLSAGDLEAAEAFFDAHTLRGRAPADAALAMPTAAGA